MISSFYNSIELYSYSSIIYFSAPTKISHIQWKIKQTIKDIRDLADSIKTLNAMGIATNDLNKNDILNIGKIPESQLNAYIQEIQSIKQANYGNFESLQIQEYANALSDLDSTQTALLLKTQGLTNAQIQQTLAAQGASTAAQYQTMVEAGLLESSTMVCSLLPEKESNGYIRRFLVKLRNTLYVSEITDSTLHQLILSLSSHITIYTHTFYNTYSYQYHYLPNQTIQ